jgi:hypothetical protein
MKITLASYFQPENHGPGRKIGITPDKPPNLDNEVDYNCTDTYQSLAPDKDAMIHYYVERNKLKKAAGGWDFDDSQREHMKQIGENFSAAYREKLQKFVDHVLELSKESGQTPAEIVGLQDGDTLLSLEKGGNQSFRSITAEYLRKLGFYVVEN